MKNCIRTLLLFMSLASAAQDNPQYSFPPEWEPHQSVWLGWQAREVDPAFNELQCIMARAISPHLPLTLLFYSPNMKDTAFRQLDSLGVDTSRIRSYHVPIENIWIRDAGPRFLKARDGRLAIANPRWTLYGYPEALRFPGPDHMGRGAINDSLAEKLKLPLLRSEIVSEGGGLDFSSSCILTFKETALQRNPGKTLEEIEESYLQLFGKKKVIWLGRSPLADRVGCGPKAGNYFGWGANGHIDEYARFVNDSTILIAQLNPDPQNPDPLSTADKAIMEENLALLKKATDVNGRPFHIITMPSPTLSVFARKESLSPELKNTSWGACFFKDTAVGEAIYWIPALSYLNYLVTNGVVLIPKYWQQGLPESEKRNDEYVKEVYTKMFPGREIVQINPLGANWQGGGMHCISQQQPLSAN